MQPFIEEYRPGAPPTVGLRDSLGLPIRGSKLHDCIRNGLPFSLLERLSISAGIEMKVLSEAVGMSHSTLVRRAKAGRFTCAESDRLYSLTTVLDAAYELFEGDVSTARDWMISLARGLGKNAPLNMLRTRLETQAVLDLIGRLEQGVIA
ncbi:antitoxin Xre-like helix-turn-helix domain-containing protein [Pseudomonas extremaustralis]